MVSLRHTKKFRLMTPSPGLPRLKKTAVRSTLSPKGERAGIFDDGTWLKE
jgi:hypothetical protein